MAANRSSLKDGLLGFSCDTNLVLSTKLPINGAVLKRLLWFRENNKLLATRQICSTVFHEEVKPLWLRSRIPISDDKSCIDKLVALWIEYLNVKSIPLSRKNRPEKLSSFAIRLNSLFDLSKFDVYKIAQMPKCGTA